MSEFSFSQDSTFLVLAAEGVICYNTFLMNKVILHFFFATLLFFTISLFQTSYAYAQEVSQLATQAAKVKIIEYDLAYPGILPDNFLYKLKVLRDKVTVFLISDPRKKVDYYLLQADKGILATAMLVDQNKIDLAGETVLKAEHNYTLLTYELKKIPKKPDAKYFQKLKIAALKHQEVLNSLLKRVPEDKQKVFNQVLEFSKRNLTTVELYQRERQKEEIE